MKVKSSVVPIILAVVAVVMALGVNAWLNKQLVPADVCLAEQIDAEVNKAQSMIMAYDPSASRMLALLKPSLDPQIPDTEIAALAESEAELSLPAPHEQDEYIELLHRNEILLSDALAIVNRAVQMGPVQVGDRTYSGNMHPAATRLQTILIYNLADLKRREAAIYQAKTADERDRFFRVYERWLNVQARLRSTVSKLTTDLEPAPIRPPTAQHDGGGAIKQLLSQVMSPALKEQPEADATEESVLFVQGDPQSVAADLFVDQKLPTIDQRIAELQSLRQERLARISETEQQVEHLAGITAQLSEKIEALNTEAREAELRMMALREAGIDPTDGQSLQQFVEQYNTAAITARQARREAEVLQKGSILNARPDSDEEEDWPRVPLAPVDPSQTMEPVRGLVAYEGDLLAARALLETSRTLLATIDTQIAELTQLKQMTHALVASMTDTDRQLKEQALRHVHRTVELATLAARLEQEAVSLLNEQGARAAQNAIRSAAQLQNDTRTFITNRENKPNHPNAQVLSSLANDRTQAGYAEVLKGDMEYCLAVIRAQIAAGCRDHVRILERATAMGLEIKPDTLTASAEAGSEPAPESIPVWVYDAGKAMAMAKEESAKALQSANQALEIYQGASDPLKQVWVLHTNIAAVRHLLARLSPDLNRQQENRRLALEKYALSIQDRTNRPEALLYSRIIDYLTANP
ncbi:MAG: hypothetical protein GXY44_14085 [Phycisphaerales bacterium]|nr:hypothetical protein [Phycisphaerales bacterium]